MLDFLCEIAWWVVVIVAVVLGMGLGAAIVLVSHRHFWAIPVVGVSLGLLAIVARAILSLSQVC